MRDYRVIQERYVRDGLPIRLGGLAANLARIKSFSGHAENREAVEGPIDESKLFIEWTAPEAAIETAAELAELQLQLAAWQRSWMSIWSDTLQRMQVAEQSGKWSERILNMSGLLC